MRTLNAVLVICAVCLVQGQRFRQSGFGDFRNTNAISSPTPSRSAYNCPEKNGRFPTGQCDSYIECVDGVGEEKLCPEGLLFNAALSPRAYPCQYPIDVDCVGRAGTQPAQPTEECPHQFGYFRIGDETNCGQFKNCVDGRGFIFDCPEGLAFNDETYRCDWPDQVKTCNAEAFLGFKCPEVARNFLVAEYRFYKSTADCQRYFICIDSKPRLYNCGEDQAFNELTNSCDGIENVTGCAPQYQAKFHRKRSIASHAPLKY